METFEKIDIKLTDKDINEGKPLDIEMVEFFSETPITQYKKLIGKVKGDKDKIAFGVCRGNRTIIFQVYDIEKTSTMDFFIVDKQAFLLFEQQFNFTNEIIEYTDYDFSFPTKAEITTSQITEKEDAVINEEIMQNYDNHTCPFRELIDDEMFAYEHEYYLNSCRVMNTEYRAFCEIILTHLMAKYKVLPIGSHEKIERVITKLIKRKTNAAIKEYYTTMETISVDELDKMYDSILMQVKDKLIFKEFQKPIEESLEELFGDFN